MSSETVIGRIFHESTLRENDIRSVKRTGKDVVTMEVVLQDADTTNRNGRRYPKGVMERAMQTEFIKEKLKTSSLLGEYNHPTGGGLARQMMIDLSNVSHVIKEAYWDPKDPRTLLGKVQTAGTRLGRDFAGLILENGMECSFSMRGAGDVVKKGSFVEVIDPLKVITWDAVHFPSHKSAYMRNIVNESTTELQVTTAMLAEYVAGESENVLLLSESLGCFTKDQLVFSVDAGKVLITEKATGRIQGFALLEQSLNKEYASALSGLANRYM